ncbi:AhpC/TSA family protein [Alteribacillus bidgolensis]|uniref:AhpC/TSA family protein n=1 Tax=Alteribacillus bidgolensis TaxID=930129 RepID=A0A1G8J4J2_9BACI|nr:AhpC/TSA family protein [Alteribacillus bidgolensis]
MQLQQHIDSFDDLDADIYAISNDSPEQHKELKEEVGFTYTFLSDASMETIEKAEMAGENASVRGFSVFDENGELITSEENDFWGDEIEETEEKIRQALE